MEEESNLNALFVEPNAYIPKFESCGCDDRKPKKVLFQEPYGNMPNYYIKPDFKKPKCDCEKRPEPKPHHKQPNFPFSFDLQSLMPLFSMFSKGNSKSGLTDIISILGKQNSLTDGSSMLSGLLQNKDLLPSILSLFKGGAGLFGQKKENQHKAKTTDFQINNYTKVD